MRMFKKGFTLVEVLIALAILGVISAILIPNVSNDIQKKQSASTLAKAIAQIETGNQDMIQYVNANSIDGSAIDTLAMITYTDLGGNSSNSILTANLQNSVRSFWGLDTNVVNISPGILTYDGGAFEEASLSNNYSFSKILAGVSIVTPAQPVISDDFDAETGYLIYIDTNGWGQKPNKTGKDVFSFKLLNDGKLVPNTGVESGNKAEEVIEAGFRIDY